MPVTYGDFGEEIPDDSYSLGGDYSGGLDDAEGSYVNEDGTDILVPNDGPAVSPGVFSPGSLSPKSNSIRNLGTSNLTDPSQARLKNAGLNPGAANSTAGQKKPTVVKGLSLNGTLNAQEDWRVRVSLPPNSGLFYQSGNSGILAPLKERGTDGVIWPYTPQISVTMNARYNEQALVHSNYKSYYYEGSDVSAIQVSGEFTVQNENEGRYVLAAIHFFRACTKMFFGDDSLAGTPPTIVYLNGYGDFYFPNVPCVVTQFQHTMPADVDYLPVTTVGGIPYDYQRVPTISTIAVTLQPVVSRSKVHKGFKLGDYAAGMLTGRGNSSGGFL